MQISLFFCVNLDCLFHVLVVAKVVGRVLSMDPSQEVHLNSMLGHPVLKLVEELATVGEVRVPLVQLVNKKACLLGSGQPKSEAVNVDPLMFTVFCADKVICYIVNQTLVLSTPNHTQVLFIPNMIRITCYACQM